MRRLVVGLVVAVAAGAVVGVGASAIGDAQARWVVRDLGVRWSLGTLDGSFLGAPHMEINARGDILGEAETSAGHAYTFLWRGGTASRLPFVPGDHPITLWDRDAFGAPMLNARGQVVGVVKGPSGTYAALWERGRVTRLGRASDAADGAVLNNRGRVAVWSSEGPWFVWERGRVIRRGEMDTSLSFLDPADRPPSAIIGINDGGEVAGWNLAGNPGDSWLWRAGKTIHVEPVARTGSTYVTDLNERGDVVGVQGTGESGLPNEPFLWTNGKLRSLAPPGRWLAAETIAINDRGQVVGSYGGSSWLWQAGKLKVRELGAEEAAINNRGQIAGFDGDDPAPDDAFLWENGRYTRLPLLPGDDGGGALALNERDQIVGISCTYRVTPGDSHEWDTWACRAVLWAKAR